MDFSDLGNRFVLAVEDLSGVWTPLYEHLKRRLPLRQITFRNKFGVQATVDELPVQFLAATDPRLQKLRQFSHSPVTWFRNPFVHLVVVSCEEAEEYKRAYRPQLKALAEVEGRLGVGPELLFVYLRPGPVDALAKGPAKVFDSMRRDLNTKRRDRCVRLDPATGAASAAAGSAGSSGPAAGPVAGTILGLEELERAMKEAIRACFEARTAAYDEEVRRLMMSRQDPTWSFSTLFLFKDSLAVMMEAAGLLDDALREYYELEAVYLEAIQAGQLARQGGFGGKAPDADEVALMWQSWHGIRQAVLQGDSVPEFAFRQFLFASQARVLLKQHRLVEVAERGLGFIQLFGSLLDQKERDGQVPPLFSTAWAFAAALSLASSLTSMQAQRAEHRRSDQGRGGSGLSRYRSRPAGGSTTSRPPSPGFGFGPATASPGSPASPVSSSFQPQHLGGLPAPGNTPFQGRPSHEAGATGSAPGSQFGGPAAVGASPAGGSSAAVTPLGRHAGGAANGVVGAAGAAGEGGGAGTAFGAAGVIDWGMGVLPGESLHEDGDGRSHRKGDSTSVLYCLLGHLYSNARSELTQLGEAAGLRPPQPAGLDALEAAASGGSLATPPSKPSPVPRGFSSTSRSHSTYGPTSFPAATPPGGANQATRPLAPTPPAHTNSSISSISESSSGGAIQGGLGAPVRAHGSLHAVDLSSGPVAGAELEAGAAQQAQQQEGGAVGKQAAGGAVQSGPAGVPPADLAPELRDPGSLGPISAAAIAAPSNPGSLVMIRHLRGASAASAQSLDSGAAGTAGAAPGAPDSSRSLGPEDSVAQSTPVSVAAAGTAAPAGLAGSGSARKLSVRTRPNLEMESQPSTPKSSISGVSSSPTRAAASQAEAQQAQQAAAAAAYQAGISVAAGGAMPDARAIERQVMSPAASIQHLGLSEALIPQLGVGAGKAQEGAGALVSYGAGGPFATEGLPPWLVHWRLRLGLASEDLFCDLWRALSKGGARCYGACGRRRHAALLHADVADVLMWRGDLEEAAELYSSQCRAALREGWYSLAAHTLPKLAACQLASKGASAGAGLADTAAAMLALPWQYRPEGVDDSAAAKLLLAAAATAAATEGGLYQVQLPLLGSTDIGGALAISRLLFCYPPPSHSSRFFGLTDQSTGGAALLPPAVDLAQHGDAARAQQPHGGDTHVAQHAQHGGALLAAVGDVVVLTVHVVSAVPAELPLSGAVLTLGVLQQLTVMYTPSTTTQLTRTPTAAPPSLARVSSSTAATTASAAPFGGGEATPRVGAGPSATPRGLRRSLSSAQGPGQSPAGAAGDGAAGADHAAAAAGGAGGGQFVSKWQEVEELQCRVLAVSLGGASLRAGVNVLTFLASPVKRGLYVPKHIRANLLGLPLHIEVQPAPSLLSSGRQPGQGPGNSSQAAPLQLLQPSRVRRTRRSNVSVDGGPPVAGPALGASDFGGSSSSGAGLTGAAALLAEQYPPEEAVLLEVQSARPRVELWPAAVGGAVIAGQRQWLGLVIQPERDQLKAASLALTWPGLSTAGASAGAAGGLIVRRASTQRTLLLSSGGSGIAPLHVSSFSSGAVGMTSTALSPLKPGLAGSPFQGSKHRSTMSLGGSADLATRLGAGGRLDGASAGPSLAPVGTAAVALPLDVSAGQRGRQATDPPQAQQQQGRPLGGGLSSASRTSDAATGAGPEQDSSSGSSGGKDRSSGELLVAEEVSPGTPGWLLGDVQEQQQFRLPGWAGGQPACAAWWWVEAGAFAAAPEVVRIASPGAHSPAGLGSSRAYDPSHFARLPGEPAPPTHTLPLAALDLGVSLEYDSGCHRSHSRPLSVPLIQPFTAHAAARELPCGTIAVQLSLQSMLAVPLTVAAASLEPQPGLVLRDSLAARLGLLPLRLPPGGCASLCYLLQIADSLAGAAQLPPTGKSAARSGCGRLDRAAASAKLAQAAKLQPSMLSVEYDLDSSQLCRSPAAPLASPGVGGGNFVGENGVVATGGPLTASTAGAAGAALALNGAQHREHAVAAVPSAPLSPAVEALKQLEALAAAAAADSEEEEYAAAGGSSPRKRAGSRPGSAASGSTSNGKSSSDLVQRCTFTHLMVLQLAPPEEDLQGALVLLRLLGPFTAVAGQPITLCWRLERSTAGPAGAATASSAGVPSGAAPVPPEEEAATPLIYDIIAEGDNWRPLGRRTGRVCLGSQPGAVATVEATWVPLMHGTLPVPVLKLQEIRYQEEYDVGNETNSIRVLPAVEGRAPPVGGPLSY
ncbi:hypothetical protein N2152v2_003273 [Parachlorella kessleri]